MKNSLTKSISIIFPIVLFSIFPFASAQQTQKELEDAQFYNNQGIAFDKIGQYDQAISSFNKAIEINPKYTDAYFNRGMAYAAKGQFNQAISDYNKVLESNPRDAEAYENRGLAYSKQGQLDQAISDFNKALEIDSTLTLAYYGRGVSYYFKQEYDKSWEDIKKAQALGYSIPAEFLDDLRKASGGKNAPAKEKLGELEDLLEELRKASGRQNAPAKEKLGELEDAQSHGVQGSLFLLSGEYDKAFSHFSRALEINPRDARNYVGRGLTYEKKGQYDEAISDYTKAIKIDPKNGQAYFNRGSAYGKKGQYDQAISDYTKAIEINPKSAAAHNGLAWLLATAKEPGIRNGEKAVEHALKACELSDWKDPNSLDTLAAAYARVGDFSNAIKWQEKALESPDLARDKEVQQRLNLYRQRKAWPADSVSDVAIAPPPAPIPSPKPIPLGQENEYINPVCKWAIHYPSDWRVDSSNPSFVTIRPATDPALVGIHCGTVDYSSLDDFVNFMQAYSEGVLKQKGQTTIVISRQPISLPNGVSGIDVIQEIRPGGKSRRVYVLIDKQFFGIDAETYIEKWDIFHPYFDRIINSFIVPK